MTFVVTGSAGFLGANLVQDLLVRGETVYGIDDLSRPGSRKNAEYLRSTLGFETNQVDVTDYKSVTEFLSSVENLQTVVHFAGQVSLVRSIEDPMRDFHINALGTVNVLEAVRHISPSATFIFSSSNKVYGALESVRIRKSATRYVAPDYLGGFVDGALPLQFDGPYSCSKGAADSYVVDYGATYGLRTFALRQSSIYGEFQNPTVDQGWLGFLVSEALAKRPIRLHGKGYQVRDLLYVKDFTRLIWEISHRQEVRGSVAMNIGGGPDNSLSIRELFSLLEEREIRPGKIEFGDERAYDQKLFISANSGAGKLFDWSPSVSIEVGLSRLLESL